VNGRSVLDVMEWQQTSCLKLEPWAKLTTAYCKTPLSKTRALPLVAHGVEMQ